MSDGAIVYRLVYSPVTGERRVRFPLVPQIRKLMNKKAKQRILNKLIEADSSLSTDYARQNRLKKLILMSSKSKHNTMDEADILNMLLRHMKSMKEFNAAIQKSAFSNESYYGVLCGK